MIGGGETVDRRLRQALDGGDVPRHVAIIMDGNGRWAADRGLPRWMGHREGMTAVRRAVTGSLAIGIDHLTLYAFSKENWSRPPAEVAALMGLLCEYVERERVELAEKGVRVDVLGDLRPLSEDARRAVDTIESTTSAGRHLRLHLAISYGGRDEIVRAARRLAERCVAGDVNASKIDAAAFASELYTAGIPDPDLLLRTSGEMRVSNFLLWQIAYAEIQCRLI
jgi:undecaprenyl diphosphate synthase